jgi:hypothetical protein
LGVWAINNCSLLEDDMTPYFSGWDTTNHAVVTMNSTQITGVGPGSANAFGSGTYDYGTDGSRTCPPRLFTPRNTTNVISAQVTTVDLPSDTVTVSLSGPSGSSGQLVVTWNGPGGNAQIANVAKGVGTYTFNPTLTNLVSGQYTGVTATWTVNGKPATGSKTYNFNVLGAYRHSQYNTPAESQCSGGTSGAYLTTGPSSCPWSGVNLVTQFISQAWINGSGSTNQYGLIQEYLAGCSPPQGGFQNYFRRVSQIAPGCSNDSLNNTTVAVDIFSSGHPLQCNDQVLIVGLGGGSGTVKSVSDSCPSCTGLLQIDDFNASSACSMTDLGNYATIRINR